MRAALRLVLALGVLLAVAVASTSCDSTSDHYERARLIERELLRSNPDAEYDDPRYVTVLRELRAVPLRHAKRDEAQAAFQRISDGRRLLVAERVDGANHLPDRLVGRTPVKPGERGFSAAPAPPPQGADEGASSAPVATTGEVILYSTTWCGYCRKARDFFRRRGVEFVEKDIEKDPAAHAEYRSKSGGYGGVPLIDVGGQVIRGFDQGAVDRALTAMAAR